MCHLADAFIIALMFDEGQKMGWVNNDRIFGVNYLFKGAIEWKNVFTLA